MTVQASYSGVPLTIEALEDRVWQLLCAELPNYGSDLMILVSQNISPKLADFLHDNGVDIDWSDRSRYGGVHIVNASDMEGG